MPGSHAKSMFRSDRSDPNDKEMLKLLKRTLFPIGRRIPSGRRAL